MYEYGNNAATIWQLKCVCRQKSGPFREWRQTDSNGGLGTWKSLSLAGIQGESGPVVRYMGPIQLMEGGGSGMTGINFLWFRKLPRLLLRIKQWNVTERVVSTDTVLWHSSYQGDANDSFIDNSLENLGKKLFPEGKPFSLVKTRVLLSKYVYSYFKMWGLKYMVIRHTQGKRKIFH